MALGPLSVPGGDEGGRFRLPASCLGPARSCQAHGCSAYPALVVPPSAESAALRCKGGGRGKNMYFKASTRSKSPDKIKAVQLLCMGYNVAKSNFKTAQV